MPTISHSEPGDVNAQGNFGVTNRKVYKNAGQPTFYEWGYGVEAVAPNGYQVTITNPDNTKIKRFLRRSVPGGATFGYDSALQGMA